MNKVYKILPFILVILSFATRFFLFGYPAETVFDEVYFIRFIANYASHFYFFDIHPPFAKLFVALPWYLFSNETLPNILNIGGVYTGTYHLWLRLVPTLLGAALPLVIYFLCRELNLSKKAAFLAGLFIIFENSLLVQSRFVLLDSTLLFFGFLGFLLYFIARRKKSLPLFIASAMSLTCAVSTKWTGGAFIALIWILEYIRLVRLPSKKEFLKSFSIFCILPLLVYFIFFAIHFKILTKSGPGDGFMSREFQASLIHHQSEVVTPYPMLRKFIEVNEQMYTVNKLNNKEHPYSSKWYTWPLNLNPVLYWTDYINENKSVSVYFKGNWFIYWTSFISVLFLIVQMIRKKEVGTETSYLLLGGYCLSLLPFMFIGRIMFLYHYQAALVFAIICTAFLYDRIPDARRQKIFIALICLAVGFFLYFAPRTYGL